MQGGSWGRHYNSVQLCILLRLSTLLLQDFFHNPPSYQAKVRLSWGVEVSGGLQGECKTSDVRGVIIMQLVKRLPTENCAVQTLYMYNYTCMCTISH